MLAVAVVGWGRAASLGGFVMYVWSEEIELAL
jgi:hypothetical protein